MIRIADNIAAASALYERQMLRQLPFATAQALNDAAFAGRAAVIAAIDRVFDRPTPFTRRAPAVQKAGKQALQAAVLVRPTQADYLRLHVEGGTRRPDGAAFLVPKAADLDAYGNLPRRALRRLLGQRDVFLASRSAPKTRHLPGGIYRRLDAAAITGTARGAGRDGSRGTRGDTSLKGGGRVRALELLVAFEDQAEYLVRWNFHADVRAAVLAALPEAFARRFAAAMRTAR